MLDKTRDRFQADVAYKIKENNEYKTVTHKEVRDKVQFLSAKIIDMGFKGQKIAVMGDNSMNWEIAYLAICYSGAIVVPIDKELHTDDIVNFMNVSKSSCILGDDKNLSPIIQNIEKLNNKETVFINFDDGSYEKFLEDGKALYLNGFTDFDNIEVNPDELRILLFTSGTTGTAKGVCLSQRNICSNLLSTYGIVKVKRSDLFFSVLPLHHTYECTLGFLLPIYSGASIAHCEGLRYIAKNMGEFHPSVILCVPLLLEKLHKNII